MHFARICMRSVRKASNFLSKFLHAPIGVAIEYKLFPPEKLFFFNHLQKTNLWFGCIITLKYSKRFCLIRLHLFAYEGVINLFLSAVHVQLQVHVHCPKEHYQQRRQIWLNLADTLIKIQGIWREKSKLVRYMYFLPHSFRLEWR